MADNQFLSNRTVSQGKPQDDQAYLSLFTARRYAIRGIHILSSCVFVRLSVCLSVCHKPVLYRNDETDRADFWHGNFL